MAAMPYLEPHAINNVITGGAFQISIAIQFVNASKLFGHHNIHGLVAAMGGIFRGFRWLTGRRRHERCRFVIGDDIINFVEFDTDYLADAVFLHGHAIEHVGHADGALVMRNDDEL